MDYFTKLTGILFKPLKVLEEYKSEEGIGKPLQFMIISAIISGAISFILQIIAGRAINFSAVSFGLVILLDIVLVFVFSGIFHLLVKLFGGPNPYFQTFKAFAYMLGFWIVMTSIVRLFGLLPLLDVMVSNVNFILGLWVLILLGSCLKHYTDLNDGKLVAIWLIAIVLFGGISFVVLLPIRSIFKTALFQI